MTTVPAGASGRVDGQVEGANAVDDADRAPVPTGHRARAVRLGRGALALVVLLCGLTLVLGFANKDRCTGPEFDTWGRSQPDFDERKYAEVCYSDIQYLWIGRDIDRHVFPYVHGGITADGGLTGGTVEYPVLTGLLIWLGALFATNDAGFLLASALIMAPFGLVTGWMLGKLSRWRALIWSLSPALVMYAFHNWELPVVACAVAAVYFLHRGWGARGADRPLLHRALVAAVLLGLGFAFKLYPAIFVLPLMLYVLTGGERGRELPVGKVRDWAGMVKVGSAALATAVAVNVPFAIAGFDGWLASFVFQGQRKADITANSIWFWGLRPDSDPSNESMHQVIGLLSPLLVFASFAVACVVGWIRYRREGTYPWIAVSAAMLCGFLLLHKVHSPQYTLWLVPMFVLLNLRWGWITAYLVADLAMGIGIFLWFAQIAAREPSGIYEGFAAQAVMIGVWGRAALLVGMFIAFLGSRPTLSDFAHRPPPLPRPAPSPA
ncbi:glycosyltransferase 87 family protein [Actinokineospora auranticolor]|uniref:Putative membrane protein n=1 Tax=Actinokineospora auranticolor TaxID=155976 RepID=A0A2S6GS55_9PSEU|nr:glycosyltransferase 87 family protein [Actinokineospora auranticolor]PPK68029.1 putative membrane protein [Actinokineospora auranticolor]